MGIGRTLGGIAGGVGGFFVGGPAGAMLGYAGGSALGGELDKEGNPVASGGRSTRGNQAQYGGYGGIGPVGEANRASQIGEEESARTRTLGQQLGTDAYFGQGTARNLGRSANMRADGLYRGADGSMANAAGADTMQQGARADTMGAIGRLRSFYEQDPGPSAAEAQLRSGNDANARNAMSIARTGGGSPSAQRAAIRAAAAGGATTNQQASVLRAQEAANWQNTRLSAMGAEQQALGNVRAGDMSAMGQHYGAAGQQLGAAGGAANTALGYENVALGYGAQGNQAQLGAANLAGSQRQSGEANRNSILGGQLAADANRYGADRGVQVGMANVAQRDRAADMAMTGSLIGSGVQMMSDIRAKENIRPASAASLLESLDRTAAGEAADVGPKYDMRPARGYAYDYRDPSMGPDNQVGPMAQDLEQTAAAGAVSTGPNGMKQVDPGRLTMTNTAAIGEQQRRLDALERMLDDSNQAESEDVGPRFGPTSENKLPPAPYRPRPARPRGERA